MDATRVGKGVNDVVEFVDTFKLKIDEKVAVCRAAGDTFQQVINAESINIMMRESIRNAVIGTLPK